MKNGKSKKEKELNTLYRKLEEISEECMKEKKEASKLKTELMQADERNKLESNKLKARIANYIKDQKVLKAKLKQCE